MRVFSFGGGVQSTAVMVLAAQGKLQYDAFVFANVGEDSENPGTLEYIEKYARPFMAEHGLNFVELRRHKRDGSIETVYGRCISNRLTGVIPFSLSNGMHNHRECTLDFKINVIARWQKKNGATTDNPSITGIGFSLDEYRRMRNDSGFAWQTLEYPLIDLRLSRRDCHNIIRDAGLPDPPKSSCWFCPFHSRSEWYHLKQSNPDLFQRAIELERHLNNKRNAMGRDEVYLHRDLIPLDQLGDQLLLGLETDDTCAGYCMT